MSQAVPIRLVPGILVAIEGIDGAGKTTLTRSLASVLSSAGFEVVVTHEPTRGPWGQKIRSSAVGLRMSPEDELHAFLEDRREHVEQLLVPAVRAGSIVLVDRYYLSTVAYQGARGFDPADLLARNEAFAPRPDLTLLVDAPVGTGLVRIRSRGDTANAFEQEAALERTAAIFASVELPGLHRIDGREPSDRVLSRALELLLAGPLRDRLSGHPAWPGIETQLRHAA